MENYHYTFYFTERNSRLAMRKNRRITFELPKEYYQHYDVDKMKKAFYSRIENYTFYDSSVWVNKIKVGNTTFQL